MRVEKVKAERIGGIPLREVSGLTLVRTRDGAAHVAAVGDRGAEVALASVVDGALTDDWVTRELPAQRTADVGAAPDQLEAVAADGAGGVLVVQEWPNRGLYLAAGHAQVAARIDLVMPGAHDHRDEPGLGRLRESWSDPEGSHTEGVVLLRDGHLLVVKEKDPSALIEFGPRGATAAGFGSDRWLGPGQAWLTEEGDLELVALAAWYPERSLADECPDFSDAELTGAGLAVLSDQGSAIALLPRRAPAADPFDGRFGAEVVLRVKKVADKPEGIAALPGGDLLIACDRKSKTKRNLFVVPHSKWRSVVF